MQMEKKELRKKVIPNLELWYQLLFEGIKSNLIGAYIKYYWVKSHYQLCIV